MPLKQNENGGYYIEKTTSNQKGGRETEVIPIDILGDSKIFGEEEYQLVREELGQEGIRHVCDIWKEYQEKAKNTIKGAFYELDLHFPNTADSLLVELANYVKSSREYNPNSDPKGTRLGILTQEINNKLREPLTEEYQFVQKGAIQVNDGQEEYEEQLKKLMKETFYDLDRRFPTTADVLLVKLIEHVKYSREYNPNSDPKGTRLGVLSEKINNEWHRL